MLLIPVVDQLRTVETAGKKEFYKVATSANFAAAKDDLKAVPSAYVLPLRDQAGSNQLGGGGAILQPVKEQFGIALAISNLRDPTGTAAQAEFERLRKLVMIKMLGFVPGDEYDPCEYVGGSLLLILPDVIWWQMVFTTTYMERNF